MTRARRLESPACVATRPRLSMVNGNAGPVVSIISPRGLLLGAVDEVLTLGRDGRIQRDGEPVASVNLVAVEQHGLRVDFHELAARRGARRPVADGVVYLQRRDGGDDGRRQN